jgi:hypothetical protein
MIKRSESSYRESEPKKSNAMRGPTKIYLRSRGCLHVLDPIGDAKDRKSAKKTLAFSLYSLRL